MRCNNLFFLLFFLLGCINSSFKSVGDTGYDLTKPKSSLILPDTLREISGITQINDTTIACIQDENGILFIYDIHTNKIKEQYKFNIDGDYEGITRVNNSLYILRSDGVLFEIDDYKSKGYKLNKYITGIPSGNNEGLCYDPNNDRLLVATKGKIGKGSEYKDLRVIYSFDLKTKKLSDQPIFSFNVQEIKAYAKKSNLDLPTRTKKKGEIEEPIIRFNTSEIAIHPLTKKLYLLSAVDHLLFIFDMKGDIEGIQLLDPTLFKKAEGLTFLENGDMLISNEAKGFKPTLLLFSYAQTK
ncbi:MAG: hypothetical protein ACT4ON_00535 [Bacteroidota bacterium]